MLKICLRKWEENKDKLLEDLSNDKTLNECSYKYLVEKVIRVVMNGNNEEPWSPDNIVEIDHGDYRGTLLYLIPKKTHQPSEYQYLITYVNYGSCSGCDTLQQIQDNSLEKKEITEEQLKDFMTLCKDILTSIIKPYNNGWREEEEYIQIEEKEEKKNG